MRMIWTACLSWTAALALLAGCQEPPESAFLPGPARETSEENAARAALARPTPRAAAAEPSVADRRRGRPGPAAIPAPPDVSEAPAEAERTESGLASRVLQRGTGTVRPGPADGVTVRYIGWRAEDGEMFDRSVARGALSGFIAGWTEGLQRMVVGEKRRLWIPASLAYEGRPGPQGMLVFDVELLAVNPPPAAPADVHAPPRNAHRTESGLASVVLQAGTGLRRPGATDEVEVHYSGWRAEDAELVDSSVIRGEPARFPLNRVIPGWIEGVQLMVEGEKRRFWIPAHLAYEGRPGPQGALVFDIELLRIP